LPIKTRRQIMFRRAHGYPLPSEPVTFSEKIQWRLIHDRRELISLAGDKLRMKAFAHQQHPSVSIPETLWHGVDLKSIQQIDWGVPWVLKPISGSGFHAFGEGSLVSSGLDLAEVHRWKHWVPAEQG